MTQRLFRRHGMQIDFRMRVEGAAAAGKPEILHVAVSFALQALEDGAVFAVHGEDFATVPSAEGVDPFAGGHHDLLGGQAHPFARLQGPHHVRQCGNPLDGAHHNLHTVTLDQIPQSSLLQGGVLRIRGAMPMPGAIPAGTLLQDAPVMAAGDRLKTEFPAPKGMKDLQGLPANRPRGPQDHHATTILRHG